MYIPVVSKCGAVELVSYAEFQLLMVAGEIMFFKRSEGWIVPGRDKMRSRQDQYCGDERRKAVRFLLD